jgi:hypothetical protein
MLSASLRSTIPRVAVDKLDAACASTTLSKRAPVAFVWIASLSLAMTAEKIQTLFLLRQCNPISA